MAFLSSASLDLAALVAAVEAPDRGAVTSFLGRVRNHHAGRQVIRLEYSAYAPMAEAECARIVSEAEARWPVRVALVHRVGALDIGDAAVVIAAAGAHRDETFAASRFVIEEVKRRVPIWKKEFYADGSIEWVGTGGALVGDAAAGSSGS
jgi:molybdopterin synthase catalytic subunit